MSNWGPAYLPMLEKSSKYSIYENMLHYHVDRYLIEFHVPVQYFELKYYFEACYSRSEANNKAIRYKVNQMVSYIHDEIFLLVSDKSELLKVDVLLKQYFLICDYDIDYEYLLNLL